MARKPNYRFDRMEKDRAKAAKKAERLKAKQERSTKGKQSTDGVPEDGDVAVEGAEVEAGEGESVGSDGAEGESAQVRQGED
jgi:hypothetical protein